MLKCGKFSAQSGQFLFSKLVQTESNHPVWISMGSFKSFKLTNQQREPLVKEIQAEMARQWPFPALVPGPTCAHAQRTSNQLHTIDGCKSARKASLKLNVVLVKTENQPEVSEQTQGSRCKTQKQT